MDPPQTTVESIKQGMGGTAVYALQKALNATALFPPLAEDGAFGNRTAAVVRAFQDLRGITADAKAGPQTQTRLARTLVAKAQQDLPKGLLLNIAAGESGDAGTEPTCYIAAVNWGVPGGVDCGYVQRRVLGPPFDDGAVRRAFDSLYQFRLVRAQLLERQGSLRTKPAVHTERKAWELAVLWHNWPSGSNRLSLTEEPNLSSYWTSPQSWVIAIGVRDVNTPLQWAHFYMAKMTRYVDWT